MRKLRPATVHQANALERVREALGEVLGEVTRSDGFGPDCPQLAKKIRSAIKSCDGARRHMEHRIRRTAEVQP